MGQVNRYFYSGLYMIPSSQRMTTVRVRATGLGAITKAYRNNPVRIEIGPVRNWNVSVYSPFEVPSERLIPFVERTRVSRADLGVRWKGVCYRIIKQNAILSRLAPPTIDSLIIGDRRRNVLRNFGRA